MSNTYRFAWPRANGDMPTSCVRYGELVDAVIDALKDHGSSIIGCTVFDDDWKEVGRLSMVWPGPVVSINDITIRVSLSPVRSWTKVRQGQDWKHARYTVE